MKSKSGLLKFILFALYGLFFVSSLQAQKTIQTTYLDTSPVIDGIFEPKIWAGSDSATQFIQMEPQSGDRASQKTAAYLGITDQNIYVVFQCYQTTPVIAKNQSRDALSKSDDIIAVLLDTYYDSRSAYVFFANPLGTQIDMKVNDDGRNLDLNWDTEWKCASKTYDWGWCVEFEIPFKSLKYKKGIENWGINFGRIIRNNFETSYWSGALTDDFRVSQSGILKGLKTPGNKMKLSLFPYISVLKSSDKKISAEFGGDIQWQISPNASLNSTINPDFATVEADQRRINLTRYELSYPEKRLFFQEGNGMYNTRIKTFYSRRIQDIDFGNRLNGKIGKTQFNVLNVKTPHYSTENPATWFTAARAKVDILKSSTFGFTLVDKSYEGGFTRSISLDYVMNLGKFWKLTGQFVSSSPDKKIESEPGRFSDNSAWFVRFARENNIYHYHIRYTEIGKKFRDNVNQTGFITDDDRREMDSDISYKWWLKNNTIEYIQAETRNNIFWSLTKGHLRSWYITESVNFYFKNRFNIEYNYNNEFKHKETGRYEKDYHNHQHTFTLGYNTDEWSHAFISYTNGDNFDRDFNLISGGARVKLFDNLSLSYSANYINYKPDPGNHSTLLNVVSANYNFNKDLWVKVFTQNTSNDESTYFYGLLGWRFKPPFGAFYVIYSRNQYGDKSGIPNSGNFFLKLTYPISVMN